MPDELGVHAALAVESLLKGEDDQHLVHALLHPAQAAALPRPELRETNHTTGTPRRVQMFGEPEVHVGEVDEDGDVGPLRFRLATSLRYWRKMNGACSSTSVMPMCATSSARTVCCWPAAAICAPPNPVKAAPGTCCAERGDEGRAVGVAGGLAGGEEDARVGWRGDGPV
jgi:hypothetical protein